jgi:sugar/nucleoside kinase (ribokinase family)
MLKEIEERTIALLPQIFDLTDGILVGDQVDDPNCGLITDKVRDAICRMGKEHPGKPILADSRARIAKFRNVMIKPNRSEAFKTAGLEGKDDGSDAAIVAAGGELSRRAGRPVFITLGEEGTYAFSGDESEKVPAYCLTGEIDICGAGDTAASAIVSSLCAGATWREAALIGNLAASLSIEQIGVTGTASPEALRKRLQEYSGQQ